MYKLPEPDRSEDRAKALKLEGSPRQRWLALEALLLRALKRMYCYAAAEQPDGTSLLLERNP
jgi:hypothetical protein